MPRPSSTWTIRAPFALMGGGGFTTEACVVAPSILIDDLELHPDGRGTAEVAGGARAGDDAVRDAVLRLLGRYIFREILASALLGTLLATFIIFLQQAGPDLRAAGASSTRHTGIGAVPVPAGAAAGAAVDHSLRRAGGNPDRAGPAGERWRNHRHARGGRVQPQSDRAGAAVRRRWATGWPPLRPRCGSRRSVPANAIRIKNQLEATQLNADITPRVFVENF